MDGYIYFIKDNLGHIKIGVAQNVKTRLSSLQTANPMQLELYQVFKVENINVAHRIEQRLHSHFRDYRIKGEWFDEKPIIDFLNQKKVAIDGYEFTNELVIDDELLKYKLMGGHRMNLDERGYNLKDVADLLGLKVRTVRQWVHDGKIQATKIPNSRRWIVMESEIKRLQGKAHLS